MPAEHEIYFSLSISTEFRPTLTITHCGGMDIEGWTKHIARVPFDALTGMKAFVVANALADIGFRRDHLAAGAAAAQLWELFITSA